MNTPTPETFEKRLKKLIEWKEKSTGHKILLFDGKDTLRAMIGGKPYAAKKRSTNYISELDAMCFAVESLR